MKTTNKKTAIRPKAIPNGTLVVGTDDGEPGTVVEICTFNRSRTKPWSYVVDTQYGREVWGAGDLFIPEAV